MRAVASENHSLRTAGLRDHAVLCSDEERRIKSAVAIGKKMRRNEK